MDNKQSFWTIRKIAGWAVKKQGSPSAGSAHEKQTDAWQEARRLATGKKDDAPKPKKGVGILSKILSGRIRPARLR